MLPLIKVLLGSKREARNFLDIHILLILVSKQFATFLHVTSKNDRCAPCQPWASMICENRKNLGIV